MKPKNFPARRLRRQLSAKRDRGLPWTPKELAELEQARNVRTKKVRNNSV